MLPMALKHKTWILKKQLPHEIYVEPTKVTGNEKSIEFVHIDKDRIVIDNTSFRFEPLIYVFGFFVLSKEFFDPSNTYLIFNIISILGGICAVVAFAYFIVHPRKYVIFDRNKGSVSIPGPMWYRNIEVPFSELVAVIQREVQYYARLNVLDIYRPDGFRADVGIHSHSLDSLHNDWAFYVWYMDKNRPLPPSPVFDANREPNTSEYVAGDAY